VFDVNPPRPKDCGVTNAEAGVLVIFLNVQRAAGAPEIISGDQLRTAVLPSGL
jgi:hypothetical protein